MPCRLALRACLATLPLWVGPALAGRPMTADDAATVAHQTCQLESWLEHRGPYSRLAAGGACGVASALELGLEWGRAQPDGGARYTLTPALKWVPDASRFDTAAGTLNLGLKLLAGYAEGASGGLRNTDWQAMALASLALSDAWALHLNLSHSHDRRAAASGSTLALALAWNASDALQLSAETQANNRSEVFGPVAHTLGARWWLLKNRLGLDLTAGRSTGGAGTRWTLGFGVYGLGG